MKEKLSLQKTWALVRLDTVINSFIVPQRDRPKTFDGNIPWCRIEDIDGIYLSKSKIGLCVSKEVIESMPLRVYPKGTVIVSCSADLGRCAIIATPLITNQTFIGLVPSEKIDSLYLYYLMSSKSNILNSMATGATIKYLAKNKFQELKIPLPPLTEQKRIAAILNEAFAALSKAKANAEQNLKNAKELFESYLQRLFEKKGDGWEIKTIGDVCESASSNVSQNKLANNEGDYPIYGASGFIKKVSFYHQDKPYLSIVKDGSGVGRVTKMDAYTSVIGTLQYILPKENIDLDYLNYNLMSVDFKKYVAGAAIPHIYFKDYKNEPFLWMPLTEQQTIVHQLDALRAETQKLEAVYQKKIEDLDELKKSILQKAFAGGL